MFDLQRRELHIVIFLISSIIIGLAFSAYRGSQKFVDIEIKRFKAEESKMRDLDESIGSSRVVNINEADVEGLMKLKGIGKKLAERVISYRSSNGRFGSISEIQNVKGIGKKLFDRIKDNISVE